VRSGQELDECLRVVEAVLDAATEAAGGAVAAAEAACGFALATKARILRQKGVRLRDAYERVGVLGLRSSPPADPPGCLLPLCSLTGCTVPCYPSSACICMPACLHTSPAAPYFSLVPKAELCAPTCLC
jgi:hypothetical protein